MADLTVLIAPTPRYIPPEKPYAFRFSKRPISRPVTPIMVTLEADKSSSEESSPTSTVHSTDEQLLSPPRNTWKSRSPSQQRSTPLRPSSAPPMKMTFDSVETNEVYPLSKNYASRRQSAPVLFPPRNRELLLPPPPLLRPTTFWRKTKKSGVTGASYSPSTHLIRRSTFLAAGLSFDTPMADISAFCVESRVKQLSLPPEFDCKFH
jgi:hypothetical protein